MTRADLEKTVIEILAGVMAIDPDEVELDQHLAADLGMDSLHITELCMDLEDEFGWQFINLPADQTVKEAIDHIEERINA